MSIEYSGMGVFPRSTLFSLIFAQRIESLKNFSEEHVGPASVDLTTTGEAYRIDTVLQPDAKKGETIRTLLPWMNAKKIEVGDTMEVGVSYLAKATVNVNFPPQVYAYFNAKSTSGRNFLFVRTLADEMFMFDAADRRHEGYSGEIWLLLEPLTYPIVLTDKECYNQARVFNADTRCAQADLDRILLDHNILFRRDRIQYRQGELSYFTHDGTVLTTLYAKDGVVGFRAKHTTRSLALTDRSVDPHDYFEPVSAEQLEKGNDRSWGVRIEAGWYYLLNTIEMIKVPEGYAAELIALDRRLGDIFTHFAGFFDPGFFGTATLEIYSPRRVFLRHGQPFARFVFERLAAPSPLYGEKSNYQGQVGTRLPKQFAPWE